MAALLEPELRRAIETQTGERAVHAFLREHPYLVAMAFNSCNNYAKSVPDFRLGGDFICDFIHIGHNSAAWIVKLIELEDPQDRLYLGDGSPSKILRKAERQIANWENWIRINPSMFRQELAKLADQIQATPHFSGHGHETSSAELLDPRTHVADMYHIVIGRRQELTLENQQRRTIDYGYHPDTIATYDRLLNQARDFDNSPDWRKEHIRDFHQK